MGKTKKNEVVEYWRNEYWTQLQKATDDSETKLEKYVFAVSTGAVGLLMGIIGLQSDYVGRGFAIASLICFSISMLLCIFYHVKAKGYHDKQSKMIEAFIAHPEKGDNELRRKIDNSNKRLMSFSKVSAWFILIGVIMFIVSVIIR